MAKAYNLELPNDTTVDPQFLRALNERLLLIAERLQAGTTATTTAATTTTTTATSSTAFQLGTHAQRLTTVPTQTGVQFFETDTKALYAWDGVRWTLVTGAIRGLLADRPLVGLSDRGMLYSASDALDYYWTGVSWTTLDDVRGGLTLLDVNTIPKITAVGILGESAVTDNGTLVTVTGRTTKLGATNIVNNFGAVPLAFGDLALGAWGNAAHSPDIASMCWGDGSGWKWSLGYNNSGTFASRYDILDSGEMRFLTLTASRPAKLNSNKGLTSGLIDLGSASDVAGTGLTGNTITKWDGTKLVNAVAGDFSGIALAGDVTGTAGATVVSLVGGSTAANVHAAELAANAATSANTASTIVKRDASGNFLANIGGFATSVAVQTPGVGGAIKLFNGDATHTGYMEWRLLSGTRLGYIGFDTANVTVNLENSATFHVAGGGAFVDSPANTTKAIVTIDGTQTITNKDLTATSNSFALPVIQKTDSISLTGQTVALTATALHVGGATAPAGIYRVSVYLVCTSAGSGGAASAIVGWHDGTAPRTQSGSGVTLSGTNFSNLTSVVKADGSHDITVQVDVVAPTGSPVYAVYVTLERIL
jgi:hypothetical protein